MTAANGGNGTFPGWFVKVVIAWIVTSSGGAIWWASSVSTSLGYLVKEQAASEERYEDLQEDLNELKRVHEEDRKVLEDKIANDRTKIGILMDRQNRGALP